MAQSGLTPLVVRSDFALQAGSARWAAPDVDGYLGVALGALRHWGVLDMRVWSGLGVLWRLAWVASMVMGIAGWVGAFEARVVRWYTYGDRMGWRAMVEE